MNVANRHDSASLGARACLVRGSGSCSLVGHDVESPDVDRVHECFTERGSIARYIDPSRNTHLGALPPSTASFLVVDVYVTPRSLPLEVNIALIRDDDEAKAFAEYLEEQAVKVFGT